MSRFTLALLLSMTAIGSAACSSNGEADAASERAEAAAPVQSPRFTSEPGGYKGVLPAIPMSPYAAASPDVVRAVYEFAARRPDVLRRVPCFCGCERNGHQDNEDCFVARRDADGRPHFDAHGLT